MFRKLTIATAAILASGSAYAYDCAPGSKHGAKYSSQAAVQSYAPQPVAAASGVTYAQPAPVYQSQPVYDTATSYVPANTQPVYQPVSATPDIVDTAVSDGSFNTLVAAVQAAGLVDTLKGPGPFTVFAPTDAAFAALPAGTVENLLKPENIDQLRAVLTYHVVPGKVTSDQLAGQFIAAQTVQGDTVYIDATAGVRVDQANVVTADLETSNGVIHVIDSVLLPES